MATATSRSASRARPDRLRVADAVTHGRDHVRGLREPTERLFCDLRTVDPHRELAGTPDDKLRIDVQRLLQLGRHPGGARPIASGVAVANRDHGPTVPHLNA